MTAKKDQNKEEKPNRLKLNKNTLKDLDPAAETVKGGGGKKPAGTGAETLTCKNIC